MGLVKEYGRLRRSSWGCELDEFGIVAAAEYYH